MNGYLHHLSLNDDCIAPPNLNRKSLDAIINPGSTLKRNSFAATLNDHRNVECSTNVFVNVECRMECQHNYSHCALTFHCFKGEKIHMQSLHRFMQLCQVKVSMTRLLVCRKKWRRKDLRALRRQIYLRVHKVIIW